MGKISDIIETTLSICKGTLGKANKKMIEENPEYILDEAIEKQEKELTDYKEKLYSFVTQTKDNDQRIYDLRNKLQKIQSRIGIAQRRNDKEAIKEGTALFKQTEKELESLLELKKETDVELENFKKLIKDKEENIQKIKNEKKTLLIQLENAKLKEEMINIKNINYNNDNSFDKAKKEISEKINKVKSMEELNKPTTKTKSGLFDDID